MADDVQLTDLEVVQRYSLAIRAASAPREELVAALESDLAWLTGDAARHRRPVPAAEPAAATRRTARKAPAKRAREA